MQTSATPDPGSARAERWPRARVGHWLAQAALEAPHPSAGPAELGALANVAAMLAKTPAQRRALRRIEHWHAQAATGLLRMGAGPVPLAMLRCLVEQLRADARKP